MSLSEIFRQLNMLISRREVTNQRMEAKDTDCCFGTITHKNPNKGFGFIDGNVFFHCNDHPHIPARNLRIGRKIEYQRRRRSRGWYVTTMKLINEQNETINPKLERSTREEVKVGPADI